MLLMRQDSVTVAQIAELCGAAFDGDGDRLLSGANALEEAEAHELSFVSSKKAAAKACQSAAGCLLVPPDFSQRGSWATISVENPRGSFARVLSVLYAMPKGASVQHATAVIDPTATIASDVTIGAHAVVGARSSIGAGCCIGSGCVIGEDVSIGQNTSLDANVTVYGRVQIGDRVTVHSGCVLGADGFGFARTEGGYQKFPQIGTVVIGNDVELGANTCIDRAALGKTVIGDGSKLDNLVHVAHNVKIGRHVVVAAQTGFSGGVTVGDDAIIGGQVGMGDKVTIDRNAIVGSGSGILTGAKVPAGEPFWGTPARPLRQYLKGLAHVNKLEDSRRELKLLRLEVKALTEALKSEKKYPDGKP